METNAASSRWSDVRRGPSKADVLAHIHKLGNYQALKDDGPGLGAPVRLAASRPHAAPVADEVRIAA